MEQVTNSAPTRRTFGRLAVLGLLGGGGLVAARQRLFPAVSPEPVAEQSPSGDQPLSVPPLVSGLLPLTDEDRDAAIDQLRATSATHIELAKCLHWLRAYSGDPRRRTGPFPSVEGAVKAMTDERTGRELFRLSPLVRTPTGVRFHTGSPERAVPDPFAAEAHRDQCLATLGELGVPLSHPVTVEGGRFTVRDILDDSLQNFHLRQRELAWTALAYLYYLAPARGWSNRFGERFTFDDLTTGLMTQPLENTSCAGTHNVFTLVLLARVDRDHAVLSPAVRQKLDAWLKRCVSIIRRKQATDGSWPIEWAAELRSGAASGWSSSHDNPSHRLLATSHLAEILLYLPPDLQAPPAVPARGAEWLYRVLRRATRDQVFQEYCPHSHAAAVVRQVAVRPAGS